MRRNFDYVAWGLICLAVSLVGFWPSYVAPLAAGTYRPPSTMMTSHVISTAAWLILLIMQPLLVQQRKVALHRQLGILGVLVAIAVVLTGVAVQIDVMDDYAVRDDYVNAVPIPFIRLSLLLGFGVCTTWAILLRNHPEWHKRLIVLGTFPLLQSPFDRMGGNIFGLSESRGLIAIGGHFGLMILFVIWDRVRQGRIHPATKWVTLALFAFYFLSPILADTWLWREIAASLARQK